MAQAGACRSGSPQRDPLARVLPVARRRDRPAGRAARHAASVAVACERRCRLAGTLPLPRPCAVARATTHPACRPASACRIPEPCRLGPHRAPAVRETAAWQPLIPPPRLLLLAFAAAA